MRRIIKQNKKDLRRLVYIVALAIGFVAFNCEAALLNCLRDLKPPELPNKELKTGYLGQGYYDELIPILPPSTNNEGYYWNFDIEGQLPEGINVNLGLGKIMFEGVPKALGIYKLKIFLDVESSDGLQICDFNGASKDYILEIKQ